MASRPWTHGSSHLQYLPGPLNFPFAFQLNQLVLLLHNYQSFCCPVPLQLLQLLVICSLTVFRCCPLHVLLAHHQIFQTSCLLSNAESHTVRFVGDTDHGTMFETVATGAKQEWVRSFGTVGFRKRTKNSGSMILDVASCVAAENGWQPGLLRGHVGSTGTSGGSLRQLRGVKAGRRRGN